MGTDNLSFVVFTFHITTPYLLLLQIFAKDLIENKQLGLILTL